MLNRNTNLLYIKHIHLQQILNTKTLLLKREKIVSLLVNSLLSIR